MRSGRRQGGLAAGQQLKHLVARFSKPEAALARHSVPFEHSIVELLTAVAPSPSC